MAQLAGLVAVRQDDGSIGSPLADATVLVRPVAAGGARTQASTGRNGRYVATVSAGAHLVAAVHPGLGETPAWTPVEVGEDRPGTLNLFLPAAASRLQQLVSAFAGEIGVYAVRIDTGDEVAVNADSRFYLASVTKLEIAAACIDLMSDAAEKDERVRIELRHHREERSESRAEWLDYQDIGRDISVRHLMERMIASSDTTATDMLCERYGTNAINERVRSWGIDGLTPVSSIIELDRRRWWLRDKRAGFIPDFALSLYNREASVVPEWGRRWLSELDLSAPAGLTGAAVWETYLGEGRDQGTARAMGELLSRAGRKRLLGATWKDELLLDVIRDGGPGRFMDSADRRTYRIDSKGGGHRQVVAAAGLVVDRATSDPVAVLTVLTQRVEHANKQEADEFIREAADLALQQLGVDAQLFTRTPDIGEITILSPRPGQFFEQGTRPLIRWDSSGVTGPLALKLSDGTGSRRTITSSAKDDGDWHSLQLEDDLESGPLYRLGIKGTDNNDDAVEAESPRFTVGGALHVTTPTAGDSLPPGTAPTIRWVSVGVSGPLRIELRRAGRRVRTIARDARDDGEWNSWTIPADIGTSSDYTIRIFSVEDPDITDDSAPFRIGGSLEVLSPGYDQALAVGSKPVIRWRSDHVNGPLRLSLLQVAPTPVQVITRTARDDGEWHSWTVPDVADGRGYRLLLEDVGAPGVAALSPLFQIGTLFEILVPSAEQVHNKPWAGRFARPHYFPYESAVTLRWRRVGPAAGNLRIELLHQGRAVLTLSDNALDDGEWHSWSPGRGLAPSSKYQLRISAAGRPTARGTSVLFSIGAHIDAHVEGADTTTFKPGDIPTIRWQTDGLGGDLTLDVLDRAGEVVDRLTGRARDDGEWHSWTIREELSGWHQIRVRSNDHPDVTGHTEWLRIRQG